MTRVLVRAPKTPFEVLTPEQAATSNAIASNAGNLVFIEAAWKLLDVPGATLTPDRLRLASSRAAEINERFDVYVIPLANAFRPSFERHLVRMTELIRQLRIPVVVLGVGAQGTVDYDWGDLGRIESTVKAFVSAVLDHSPSVGVRGEGTLAYLNALGFRDVDVIGCPSMFMWGRDLDIRERSPSLPSGARLGITISPYRPAMGRIALTALDLYPDLLYLAQDLPTLELLLDGRPLPGGTRDAVAPVHPAHRLFREDRARFFVDPWPWIDELRGLDYVFGTRIHGTIAALLAGTPATVLAHDSRTLELARYFGIPHRLLRDVPRSVTPGALYEGADTTVLVKGHQGRVDTLIAFLELHRLDHAFAHPWAFRDFEAKVAATPYPGAVHMRRPAYAPADLARRFRASLRDLAGGPAGKRLARLRRQA